MRFSNPIGGFPEGEKKKEWGRSVIFKEKMTETVLEFKTYINGRASASSGKLALDGCCHLLK